MNIASNLLKRESDQTPLKHLFAYIRDLFHTVDPVYQFDPAQSTHWFLSQWVNLAKNIPTHVFDLQWEDPYQPLGVIQKATLEELTIPAELEQWIVIWEPQNDRPQLSPRKEIISRFEEDSQREQLFDTFAEEVQGKPLEAVAHIEIPEQLNGWINFEIDDEKIQLLRVDKTEKFEDDPHRVEMYQMFSRVFGQHWDTQWAYRQVNKLYDSLHTLYYELKSHPHASLYLSFGLISGKIGHQTYQKYLFHLPLELQLKQQQISILADTLGHKVECEQNFTDLIPDHFPNESTHAWSQKQQEVIRLVEDFNQRQVAFSWDKDYLKKHFYQIIRQLMRIFPNVEDHFWNANQPNWQEASTDIPDTISFHFAPIIQLRQDEQRIHISRDAARIIEKLDNLEKEKRTHLVPSFFHKLFTVQPAEHPIRIIHKKPQPLTPEEVPTSLPSQVLFPLPYNHEQLAIAHRLTQEDAVTIQGPPGTGKSHTIANIAAHHVAQGKSILIVSKNAKALNVIRNKLPRTLRALAVSWIESDQNIEQLKYAIDALKEHLGRSYSQDTIDSLTQQLSDLEHIIQNELTRIQSLLTSSTHKVDFHNPYTGQAETRTLAQWAKWLRNHPYQPEYLMEDLTTAEETEVLPDLLAQYFQLHAGLDKNAFNWKDYEYPSTINWITPERLEAYTTSLQQLSSQVLLECYSHISPHLIDKPFLEKWEETSPHIETLDQAAHILRQPQFKFSELAYLLDKHEHLIRDMNQKFWEHEWEISALEAYEPEVLMENLLPLINKFKGQHLLSRLKKATLNRHQKKFFDCKIDRIPVETLDQLELLSDYIDFQRKQKSLCILLRNYMEHLGQPWEDAKWRKTLNQLIAIHRAGQALKDFNTYLSVRGFPTLHYGEETYAQDWDFVSGLSLYKTYKENEEALHQSLASLRLTKSYAAPIIGELLAAAENHDVITYTQKLAAYEYQRNQASSARSCEALAQKLINYFPNSFDHIKDQASQYQTTPPPDFNTIVLQVRQELFQQQLRKKLDMQLENLGGSAQQWTHLQHLTHQKEALVEKLIAYKTWYHKSQHISDEQRAALTAWRNDLINIGKGQGKNSARNLQAAIENMQRAKEVVPIWIMQQDTAIKFFADTQPGQFDLLIVDEASQCDISTLNLIFRAQKSMIVGDENQTATALPPNQFPIARTNQILDRYLMHHPFREQFNINNKTSSIYSLSGVIYPNIITLMEHFRCRPEIIGYSNQYVYNQQMIPLKTATHSHWGSPVEVYYVEEEAKFQKRPNIVEKVQEIIESMILRHEKDPSYPLPTIGVLTLDSSNDTHQEQLIRVLARSAIIRRYEDDLQLLIGTARKFQGDERDIMILTSTAIHRRNSKGSLRPPRAAMSEEMMRIYNVAASRAKEKSTLIHCIAPEAVAAMNPQCYRKKLIDYYASHKHSEKQESKLLEDLLKRVSDAPDHYKKEICAFLYRAQYGNILSPSYQIGIYQLDFALIDQGKKLAIICDTDQIFDKNRLQQYVVLQRVGWKLFYISEIQWQYNREAIESQLLNELDKTFTSV